jgi:hypothetical protein
MKTVFAVMMLLAVAFVPANMVAPVIGIFLLAGAGAVILLPSVRGVAMRVSDTIVLGIGRCMRGRWLPGTAVMLFFILSLLMVISPASAQAQVFVQDKDIFTNKHFADSAAYRDSVYTIAITYAGGQSDYYGQLPDSVGLLWDQDATGDSVKLYVYLLTQNVGGEWERTLVDSIEVAETDKYMVPIATYTHAQAMGVLIVPQNAGNAKVSASSRTWLKLRRYFTKA